MVNHICDIGSDNVREEDAAKQATHGKILDAQILRPTEKYAKAAPNYVHIQASNNANASRYHDVREYRSSVVGVQSNTVQNPVENEQALIHGSIDTLRRTPDEPHERISANTQKLIETSIETASASFNSIIQEKHQKSENCATGVQVEKTTASVDFDDSPILRSSQYIQAQPRYCLCSVCKVVLGISSQIQCARIFTIVLTIRVSQYSSWDPDSPHKKNMQYMRAQQFEKKNKG